MENGTLEIRNFLVLARLLGFLYKKKRVLRHVLVPVSNVLTAKRKLKKEVLKYSVLHAKVIFIQNVFGRIMKKKVVIVVFSTTKITLKISMMLVT